MLTSRVRRELQRRGNADVALFVKSIASRERKRGRRQAIEVDPSDLGRLFLDDERNFVSRLAKEKRLREQIERLRSPPTNSPERVSIGHGYFSHFHYFPRLGIALGTVTDETLRSAAKIPVARLVAPLDVSPIRPIRRRQIARPSAPVCWGIRRLKIDTLWSQGVTGNNVLVGHIDTGVGSTHSTLTGAVRDFAFIDESGQVDPFQTVPFDADDHGTHTAGTIAGRPAGGFHVGVAPGALLLSVGVIESGTVSSRLISGLAWAVDHGAQIVNVSLGVRGYDEDFLPLTRRLREIGVLPVFAVGNEGPNTSRSRGTTTKPCQSVPLTTRPRWRRSPRTSKSNTSERSRIWSRLGTTSNRRCLEGVTRACRAPRWPLRIFPVWLPYFSRQRQIHPEIRSSPPSFGAVYLPMPGR